MQEQPLELEFQQDYDGTDSQVTLNKNILYAKAYIGFTSTMVFTIACMGGCFSEVHRAPSFVRN